MSTPEKTLLPLSAEVTRAINERLHVTKQSKKWLANRMNKEYGRVKRMLNINDVQQLSIDDADAMLVLLGSSLRDVLTAPVVETLQEDISNSLSKHRVSWRQ